MLESGGAFKGVPCGSLSCSPLRAQGSGSAHTYSMSHPTQGGGRELGSLGGAAAATAPAATPDPIAAANAELKGIQFRAVTAFNRLRDDVGRLGTPADTAALRRRVVEGTARFKGLALEFRQRAAQHPARNSSASQKLLRDFQGLLRSSERVMERAKAKEAASLPFQAAAVAAQQQQSSEATAEEERRALLEAQRKQEVLLVENSLRFNEAVIEERDAAITEISGQIGEVRVRMCVLLVLLLGTGDASRRLSAWQPALSHLPCHDGVAALPLSTPTNHMPHATHPPSFPPYVPASRCTRSFRTLLCW